MSLDEVTKQKATEIYKHLKKRDKSYSVSYIANMIANKLTEGWIYRGLTLQEVDLEFIKIRDFVTTLVDAHE